jgi:hypothetical protein
VPDALDRLVGRVPRVARIVIAVGLAAWALSFHTSATLERSRVQGRGDVALADIRDAGIFPARAWLDGVNPWAAEAFRAYDVRIGQDFPLYSPVHVLAHLPFAPMPLEGARETYYWLSLGGAALLAALTLRVGGRRPTLEAVAVVFAAIVVSHPGALGLVSGQSGVWLAIGGVLAATAASPALAVLGTVVVLTKPTFGVPVLVMMVARRRVRPAVIGTAIAAAISVAMVLRLVAAEGWRAVIDGVRDSGLDATAVIGNGKRVDLASLFARVTDTTPTLAFELAVAVAILTVAFVTVRRADTRAPASDVSLAIALATPPLVLFHGSWDLITVVPLVALLLRRDPGRMLDDARRWVAVGLVGYALWNPWGRRFSDGLWDDRLHGVLAATLRGAAFAGAWAVLVSVPWWRRADRRTAVPGAAPPMPPGVRP